MNKLFAILSTLIILSSALYASSTVNASDNLKFKGFGFGFADCDDISNYSGWWLPQVCNTIAPTVQKLQDKNLNVNTARLPIFWKHITGPYGDKILQDTANTINKLLQQDCSIILDLHSYMKINYPTGYKTAERADVRKIWNTILKANNNAIANLAHTHSGTISSNSPQLILEVMNEPNVITSNQALQGNLGGMEAIRDDNGLINLIFIEGTAWSGLHSWCKSSSGNSTTFIPDNIPYSNYAIAVHQYFDPESKGTRGTKSIHYENSAALAKGIHFQSFIDWVNKYKVPVILDEFGYGTDPIEVNGQEDAQYMIDLIQNNIYTKDNGGFIGWTGWIAGAKENTVASDQYTYLSNDEINTTFGNYLK